MPARIDVTERRRKAIRNLLQSGEAADHEAIVAGLRRRGFDVTQPSVSRDLRAIGAAKIEGRWVLARNLVEKAAPTVQDALAEVLGSVREVRIAGPHMLVIATLPAKASAVAMAIDQAGLPGVAGTVAGDDTVFVAVAGRRAQASLAALLGNTTSNTRTGA